jgi:regulator of RNase E activity RraA
MTNAPAQVLVMSSVGPWESVGGDIKFLRLKQRAVGGLVTDGSVRDTDTLLSEFLESPALYRA